MMWQWAKGATFLAIFAFAAALAQAKNVDLSTVPARQGVQLTIYNSEDLTLVRETRKVSFKPGANPLAVQLGQHAYRPHVGPTPVSQPSRQAGTARHDLPARQAADALLERAERDWTARRRSRSPTSPAASVGRPITFASPTRPRPKWASRVSFGCTTIRAKSTRTPRCG